MSSIENDASILKGSGNRIVLSLALLGFVMVCNIVFSTSSQLRSLVMNDQSNMNDIFSGAAHNESISINSVNLQQQEFNEEEEEEGDETKTTAINVVKGLIKTEDDSLQQQQQQQQQQMNEVGDNTIISKCGVERYPGSKTSIPYDKKNPPNVTLKGGKWFLTKNMMIVPEYKLMFCFVEKVGCTMFQQLFRLLRMYNPSLSDQERKHFARSMYYSLTPQHLGMRIEDLNEMMMDPSWTKAMFIRDPATRFLSGFKSKCTKTREGGDTDAKGMCTQGFGPQIYDMGPTIQSFQQAIDIAVNNTNKVFSNRHWRPARDFCGGLSDSLDYYDFIHLLDRNTVTEKVRRLFLHVGVDTNLTERLIDVVKTGGRYSETDIDAIKQYNDTTIKGTKPSAGHDTSKRSKLSEKDYFQSPQALQRLQEVYKMDYELFQIQPITFDEL